ncbi:conserved oligomeric Golgi complex subunit 1-like isoform X1 [Amphibalanus amphitrite]|uniref:conserved oligomeric Golgi complex subunit 1-like isoform X1 n=2 Tax=Amphibalanus amphitrite TaxID=1232801 RepID=UPI001C918A43|nr:conserved oligomeric Golgi complex subunit 1-like isoform X1 [Amphibalanus amphitrite]
MLTANQGRTLHSTMDIQALFEQCSVPEIQAKLEETRQNIEKEREELRIMVSERYRDLIEAADSIVDMQKCAEQICQHVKHIESGCSHLQHQGLIGFKGRDDKDIARQDRKRRLYDIGARVKLLMDMPETLWLRVERRETLTAALLHLLAQYIFTGLQVERLHGAEGQRVMKQFPVVVRQWTAIQRFRATILSSCHAAVRDATLQQLELVGSCLVAAALLEGSSARAACSHLLRERREAVLAAVRADSAEDSVQRQVARAARLLLHTLQLVMALFVGHNPLNDCPEGQFVTRLRDVIANQKPFELVDDRGSVAMRHLSADIKGYRPSVAAAESSLPADQVQTMVSEWLQQLAEQLRPRVAQLLEGVPSVKGLASVRDGVYSVLSEDPHRQHWGDICRTLTGAELSIWELFPREAILVRAEQHIKAGLSSAFSAVTESLAQTVKAGDRLKSAVDIVDYRWSDVNEAPSVSGWMNYRHRNQQSLPGLVLRARGHCGPVQELCAALDSRLDALLTDVRHYTERPESARPAPGEAAAPSAAPPPFDPWRDSGRLAETLREQTRAQLDGLLTELERLAESPEQQSAAVLLARVPRGVTDLCPHLPLCLDATARGKQPSGAGRALWEELAQQLLRVRPALMRRWCEARAAQLDQQLSDALKTATDAQLSDFALWAAVTITEEADSGEQVESVIRVPRCPRLSLSSALYQLATDVNRLGSMTLGREVQGQLVQCSVRRLVDVYCRHLAASDVTPPSQHHALQALVDVHFLKTLASARDQELTKKIGSTCEAIEEHIDPFDLNVCWPHAVKYLRQYTQQSQSVLGALSVDRGPARPAGPAPAASGQPEPHSLLALADRPVRFSLLAVPDSAPLERPPRPLPSCPARLDKMASQQSPKKADAIKPSPSFLANFSGSWF